MAQKTKTKPKRKDENQIQNQAAAKAKVVGGLSCPTEKSPPSRYSSKSKSKSGPKQGRKPTQSSRPSSKFRWISAGQTERPRDSYWCGSACGGRWSRGDSCRPNGNGRRRKLVKSLETDRFALGEMRIDWVEK